MAFYRSVLVFLATNLAGVESRAGAGIKTGDIIGINVRVPLLSVKAAFEAISTSLSLSMGKGFQQRLLQAKNPAIAFIE